MKKFVFVDCHFNCQLEIYWTIEYSEVTKPMINIVHPAIVSRKMFLNRLAPVYRKLECGSIFSVLLLITS